MRLEQIILEYFQADLSKRFLSVYVESGSKDYSAKDFLERLCDYIRFYKSENLQYGDVVVIIAHESLDLIASFIASMFCGLIPAYFAYPSPKQKEDVFARNLSVLIESNKKIKLIICDEKFYNSISRFMDKVVVVEEVFYSNEIDINLFKLNMQDEEICFIQFSSGTTGLKKSVKVSIKSLINQLEAYSPFVQFGTSSSIVSWLPHYHDMGLIACTMLSFYKKIPLAMMSPFLWVQQPWLLFDMIKRYKGSHLWLPNFSLGHLIKKRSSNSIDLSTIKQIILCSEPVMYNSVERFISEYEKYGLRSNVFSNCYAMAENTFAMTSSNYGELKFIEIDEKSLKSNKISLMKNGKKIASAGVALNNVKIIIIDEEKNILSDLQVGEILIKSNCLFDRYENNEKATNEAFYNDYFITGDIGFTYENELYVTGRKKDLIIVNGENFYPQDIEQILNEIECLIPGRNLAFGLQDEEIGTERIVVLAEVYDADKVDKLYVKSRIFEELNISINDLILLPHMSLLKGTAGKVSRSLNKESYLNGFLNKSFAVNEANNEKSDKLLSILQKYIFDKDMQIDDSTELLTSGAINSLGFVDMVLDIEKKYKILIPEKMWSSTHFNTAYNIRELIKLIKNGDYNLQSTDLSANSDVLSEDIPTNFKYKISFIDSLIMVVSKFSSYLTYKILKYKGVNIGKNVVFRGDLKILIKGQYSNIVIGDSVVFGNNVEIRNRENGKIIIKNNVVIDDSVRLLAAREGVLQVGQSTKIGRNSILSSGGIIIIGNNCLLSGNININSSSHGTKSGTIIQHQNHLHGKIIIEDDVWMGFGVNITMNSYIKNGAIISANSLVNGIIDENSIVCGVPAKFIRYR